MPSSDTDERADGRTDSRADLSRDEIRELVREEARDAAREEVRAATGRTRTLAGGLLAAALGFAVLLTGVTVVDGSLTVALVGVGALFLVAAGVSVTSAFDGT